jgi:hypothetical protein
MATGTLAAELREARKAFAGRPRELSSQGAAKGSGTMKNPWYDLYEFLADVDEVARRSGDRHLAESVEVLSSLIGEGRLEPAIMHAWCMGWLMATSHHSRHWKIGKILAGQQRGRAKRKEKAAADAAKWLAAIAEMRRGNPRLSLTGACRRLSKQLPSRDRRSWRTIYERIRDSSE